MVSEAFRYPNKVIAWRAADGKQSTYVYVDEFKGHDYLHVRMWYFDKDGVERPTKKGVAVRVENAAQLLAALKMVVESE